SDNIFRNVCAERPVVLQYVVPNFLELIHVHCASTYALRQHNVGWFADCGSSPNPVSPVVCVASKRLRFAVADRPDAQISAFELIGGHYFDVHDVLITAALDGSLNVRNQVTWVHGAEALDSEAVSDVHRDLTLSLSRRGLDTLSIVYVRCYCTARRNCDVTQRCTPA
ncbi:hypothetical protein LTR54_018278, partial [Friedmanniomyces endolithicus]